GQRNSGKEGNTEIRERRQFQSLCKTQSLIERFTHGARDMWFQGMAKAALDKLPDAMFVCVRRCGPEYDPIGRGEIPVPAAVHVERAAYLRDPPGFTGIFGIGEVTYLTEPDIWPARLMKPSRDEQSREIRIQRRLKVRFSIGFILELPNVSHP